VSARTLLQVGADPLPSYSALLSIIRDALCEYLIAVNPAESSFGKLGVQNKSQTTIGYGNVSVRAEKRYHSSTGKAGLMCPLSRREIVLDVPRH
jgi:hypothetical protein